MQYVPMSNLPLAGESLGINPKTGLEYEGCILLLDELLQADKYVQGASFRLILDREVGENKLHPDVRIVCASNRSIDQAGVNKMLSPLKSRLTHIDMVLDQKEFIHYVEQETLAGNWHPLILGFINFLPTAILDYDVKTIDTVTTYSCPRTLEMLSDQLNAGLLKLPDEIQKAVIEGVIGTKAGQEFNSYVELYQDLPTIQEIVKDPENCKFPETSIGGQWAISALLFSGITKENTPQLVKYINRIPSEDIRVVIYRTLLKKNSDISNDPEVQKTLQIIHKRLNEIN